MLQHVATRLLQAHPQERLKPTQENQEENLQRELYVRLHLQVEGPRVVISVRSSLGQLPILYVTRRALASVVGSVGLICRSEVDDVEVTLRTAMR